MVEIPIIQLFLAGTFAIILSEGTKRLVGITESNIGLHRSDSGKLLKARTAAAVYVVLILISNVGAYYAYNIASSRLLEFSIMSDLLVDSVILLSAVLMIWVYLRVDHYSR